MNVGLDATPLTVETGGIRRYVEELHRALEAEYPEDRFALMSDQREKPKGMLERRWWSYGVNAAMARGGVEVFHGTDFSVPYRRTRPAVMTVHDLSPWRFGEASSRVRRRTPWLIRLNRATLYITPSEAIRREMSEYFRVPMDRIVATPLAAAEHFRPVEASRPPERPYFLFVGTVEPRKGLEQILPAVREVHARTGVELRVAGRLRQEMREEPGIRILGAVREDELPGLYSQAMAVVVPSRYEGFGLPVVEAMSCGAAVLTSRDAALSEAGGEATEKLESVAEWRAALLAAVENPDWRAGRREASLRRAQEFSWKRTARLTREVYDEAQRRA